jgi:hypothetical protein
MNLLPPPAGSVRAGSKRRTPKQANTLIPTSLQGIPGRQGPVASPVALTDQNAPLTGSHHFSAHASADPAGVVCQQDTQLPKTRQNKHALSPKCRVDHRPESPGASSVRALCHVRRWPDKRQGAYHAIRLPSSRVAPFGNRYCSPISGQAVSVGASRVHIISWSSWSDQNGRGEHRLSRRPTARNTSRSRGRHAGARAVIARPATLHPLSACVSRS